MPLFHPVRVHVSTCFTCVSKMEVTVIPKKRILFLTETLQETSHAKLFYFFTRFHNMEKICKTTHESRNQNMLILCNSIL